MGKMGRHPKVEQPEAYAQTGPPARRHTGPVCPSENPNLHPWVILGIFQTDPQFKIHIKSKITWKQNFTV